MAAGSIKAKYECLVEWLKHERGVDIYPKKISHQRNKKYVRGYRKKKNR